jgi:serine/threonine protein kinase/predicted RNA polymerase sigma factor
MSLLKLASNLDAATALLVEELIEQLQAGAADAEAFLAAHPEQAATLRRLLPALRMMADLSNAPADERPSFAGDATPLGELGDFRLVREVGRGGMGVVYEAEQLSLRRRVALKMLPLAAALEPKQLQRFKNEAVAAASLHHEHIIPVYAVGCERSVHFYAMQFIEGCTLAQVIQALQPEDGRPAADPDATVAYWPAGAAATPPAAVLSTERSDPRGRAYYRRVAELAAQAAEALEHAHGLGIVHRDIKPGNLLVDPAGKLWVGDFGLARLGAEAGLTLSGDLLGTLRYMAPEQALARHGLVDHRADVYGLGATLYELLTLRPAVTATERAEVLRQVAFEEPTAPRKLDRGIPVELETVALKCVAKNPAERYATAGDLAEDLRRWLADQPIRAKRPSLAQRTRRWSRRHRALVGGGAAALLVGLCAALAVLGLKNRELTAANERERQARTEAEAAQEAAEQRFALAQSAVDQYLNQVTDDPDLKDKHGLHALRKRLLETAVPFYRQLAQQKPGDDKQEAARGLAYQRLARVQELLGETAAALATYEQMRAAFARLAADFPTVPDYRYELARSHNSRGVLLAAVGKRPEAEAEFRQALALQAQLARDFPAVPEYRQGLANGHNNLGLLLAGLGKRPEAEAHYRQALALQEKLAADFLTVPEYRSELTDSHNGLGILLQDLGKRPEAEAHYRQALALQEKLTADHPTVPKYRLSLARVHMNLGGLLMELGKRPEAEAVYRRAIELSAQLAADYPTVPEYRLYLAANRAGLGGLLYRLGKRPEAEAEYRQALALQEKLAADFPTVPEYRQDLAASHYSLGILLQDLGKRPEAEAEYRRALALQERLAADFPAVPTYRQDLASSHTNLGLLLNDLRKWPEAEAETRRALALKERLVADFPTVPAYAVALGGSYCNVGVLLRDGGQPAPALEWFAKAIGVLQQALDRTPDVTARQFLLNSHWGRAVALSRLGRHAEAVQDWDRAIALDEGPMRLTYCLGRALTLAHAGEDSKATSAVAEVLRSGIPDAGLCYIAACVYAVAAAHAARAAPAHTSSLRAEQHSRRAVALLRDAVARGFQNVADLKKDPDLEPLRARADFQQLVADLEAKQKPAPPPAKE